MIAVIGGVKTTVNLKMAPPERDIEKQKKQDEEALRQAGIDLQNQNQNEEKSPEESELDARFRQYYQQKMQEQASDNYWDEVGLGGGDFGGYPVYVSGENSDIKVASSGCGYTVAGLLGRKQADVAFISAVGNDALGLAAKAELSAAGVDISGIGTMEAQTSVGIEIHNMMGDLEFCRENNELIEAITPETIEKNSGILDRAEAIFMDGSLSVETMNYVSDRYGDSCRIFFDPASMYGGGKFAESHMKADCVVPGRMEAEAMTGKQVLGIDQLMAAGETLEKRGVARTVITLKGGGLYYKEGAKSGLIKPEENLSFVDTKGAGDVLTAELVYRLAAGEELEKAAQSAMDETAAWLAGRRQPEKGQKG